MTLRKFLCALTALLLAVSCAACGAGGTPELPSGAYPVEKNAGDKAADYPYVIHTPSADWYLAAADLELLGEEAYLGGLDRMLEDQEADFTDAREALAPWLLREVPPIPIYTDFSGLTYRIGNAAAYYNGNRRDIFLYSDWQMAGLSLLHEYVHYLTFACAKEPISQGFYSEGVAEYVSRFVCTNRMCRASFRALPPEQIEQARTMGFWDDETNSPDLGRWYLAEAEWYASPASDGSEYNTIVSTCLVRSEEIRENPNPATLSYPEAGAMTAYLVETFGEDAVFACWGLDPYDMKANFGRDFAQLYRDWAAWNTRRCAELGLTIPQG